MNDRSEMYIRTLGLEPHPEGGHYAGTFAGTPDEEGGAHLYTSIYFLLESGDCSRLHRLKSDELWYFHDGGPLDIHMIFPDGSCRRERLGLGIECGEKPQVLVPAGTIFGSEPAAGSEFSLVGCMVAPGFDFADFELFTQNELLVDYPQHEELIRQLAYPAIPK
ncbi:cupin domain-containing protein [Bhargavaea ullalensis]|uniref:Cupin superfamily sugar epimerase n=1 Tax=Bhargavaea ullalensis TaxID=1265685 RepID=A0ABV2GAL4_9BACL